MTDTRQEILRSLGMPATLASFIEGDTADQMKTSAAKVADALGIEQEGTIEGRQRMKYEPPVAWTCIACSEMGTGFNGDGQPVCAEHQPSEGQR